MDNYYSKNINTISLKEFPIYFKNINSDFYLKKKGKLLFIPKENLLDYACFIYGKIKARVFNYPPKISGKNDDEMIKKLLLLYYIQNNFNLKYIKINDIEYIKNIYINNIYLYNPNVKGIEDIVLNILFYFDSLTIKYKNKKLSLLKNLTISFMILKKTENNNNNNLLVKLFYEIYIFSDKIKDFLIKNNKNYYDFANYNDLYIFLKKYGYVHTFYNIYAPKIIKNYRSIYRKIINNPKLEQFKKNKMKEIKSFKDIDIIKYIDNYSDDIYNKKYIKNKFIEIIKNYNIK